jgi:hypothetical protein
MFTGLKKVDLRNNGLTPKAMHTLATALKGNVTLLYLKLSEPSSVVVVGDDVIIDEESDNSGIQRQETTDINELEKILAANRNLAKVRIKIHQYQSPNNRLQQKMIYIVL